MKFGEFLVSRNQLPQSAIDETLELQKYRKLKLGRMLRDLGYISQEDLNRNLALFLKPENTDSISTLSMEVRRTFPEEFLGFASKNNLVPYKLNGRKFVCLTNCYDDRIVETSENDEIRVELQTVSEETLNHLRKMNGEVSCGIELSRTRSDDEKIAESDPYTSLFRDIILFAKKGGASDIHIQPTLSGVDIRLRVNGELRTHKTLSKDHRQGFINEVKRLANLSIAVSGKAQDARVSFKNWELDIRASLLPSQYGEKIVLRLLDLTRQFDIKKMGIAPKSIAALEASIRLSNGVVIVSGPTGSGKTTTLYSLLSAIDRKKKNIVTIEDPIEYSIEGLTQVQVTAKLSFAEALRSILRQDPDVILVGEIRDSETADLCMKAANTGHLVFSTLHANGAKEVVGRLLGLGIKKEEIQQTLKFSFAQRLVKQICPGCSRKLHNFDWARFKDASMLRRNWIPRRDNLRVRNPDGCDMCRLGLIGRLPIIEYLDDKRIQRYLEAPNKYELRMTLLDRATFLAEEGEIDAFEALEL